MTSAPERLALAALDRHEGRLVRLAHVVALGVVPLDEARPEAELAVAVYVDRKLPASSLPPGELVPPLLEVEVEGQPRAVRTRVLEAGAFPTVSR
ncbi:MAG: hypothetical protein ABIO70_36355 [Pseudomonadota bacterium]